MSKENFRYVKLGDKAESFFDAKSRVKVTKDKVVSLGPKALASTRVKHALQYGHLQYADSKEFEAQNDETKEVEETQEENTLSIAELAKKAKALNSEYSLKNLKKMSEEELLVHITDLEAAAEDEE